MHSKLLGVLGASFLQFATTTHFAFADTYSLTELYPLSGFTTSYAVAINNSGTAVGYSSDANNVERTATVWTNGAASIVGTFSPSEALAINNAGQIVGSYGAPLTPVTLANKPFGLQQSVVWNGNTAICGSLERDYPG